MHIFLRYQSYFILSFCTVENDISMTDERRSGVFFLEPELTIYKTDPETSPLAPVSLFLS
jgi:hypothetical protein